MADDGERGGLFRRLRSAFRAPPTAPSRTEAGEAEDGLPLIAALIGAMPSPAIVLDNEPRVVAFNDAAHAIITGLRHGEPAFLTLRTPDLVEAIRRALATREPQKAEFIERVPQERWFEVYVTPLPASEPALLLMTFDDRTPLAALLGFIETLQGPAREDPAARERFLGIMQSQATRMARLIDDLLSLSRIELNAHLRPSTPVDLRAIVRQVADGLQPLARDRGVEIRTSSPDQPLVVAGDRDELIRALENLVENALKYGASGKRADIALTRRHTDAGEEARLEVRDYGPGIAPEHLPRLTERFYRVDVADSRSQGGTGLGLALVKHVLYRHGGRLTIESARGEGARFTAHLPLRTAERPGRRE
jgi:two-component system phosphate regulon sensor histidine kinase PhoR